MSGQRIILVDNDANWRKNSKSILSKVGYLVIGEAVDGVTAIKLVRARQPDLVIIEASIPGMEGVEVAKILNEDNLAPVILTANSYQQELIDKAVNAGVQSFLIKPIDESHLVPAVELALANYHEMVKLQRKIKQLEEKLESRKVIERAKGILMETMGLTEAQAFKKLQKQSMNKRVSMRAVAEAVIMAHNLRNEL
ncbi:response regulator NasT [Desulfohalotomaculum tongense]|uniref:ANTAR domain-containing response regulator n=1 Tax=Desulforadius tongensis TaxID=1216062 RepID=UPI00195DD016|nr:ANTAR domain-containing protein [Desulforadius tongensis]MBM7855373.1 response regulator NasT [Desulforadius tongensis]